MQNHAPDESSSNTNTSSSSSLSSVNSRLRTAAPGFTTAAGAFGGGSTAASFVGATVRDDDDANDVAATPFESLPFDSVLARFGVLALAAPDVRSGATTATAAAALVGVRAFASALRLVGVVVPDPVGDFVFFGVAAFTSDCGARALPGDATAAALTLPVFATDATRQHR